MTDHVEPVAVPHGRRRALGIIGVSGTSLAVGLGLGGGLDVHRTSAEEAMMAAARATSSPSATGAADGADPQGTASVTVPFRGTAAAPLAHQAGITTAAQDRLLMAAFDVLRPDALAGLLSIWTTAAGQLTAGQQLVLHAPGADVDAPPDSGETLGSGPARLTLTIGYGATLFPKLGLAAPELLRAIPAFPGDEIDPAISGGDLMVQACTDDPEVAFHAIRALTRLGADTVAVRWLQQGFGRTSSTGSAQATPRNLMGFKDGTRDVRADQTAVLDRYVWAQPDLNSPWLDSFMVARKIVMDLPKWDSDGLDDQEDTFGRRKASGAPFGRKGEFDTPIFSAMPRYAHVRRAAPENNGGNHILRRGYSFADGVVNVHGDFDAGLFFVAFMAMPQQFVELQTKLSAHDNLNEYITHRSSALFAIPAGLDVGDGLGQSALAERASHKPIPQLVRK